MKSSNKRASRLPISRLPVGTLTFAALICFGQGASVQAATATGVMTVSATVLNSCLVGASALAFPAATSNAIAVGNVDAVGQVTVNCTSGSAYTVALDAGGGAGGTFASRKMSAAGNQLLKYSIYTAATYSTVWGDGSGGSATVAGVGTGVNQSIFAYGRIFAGQVATAAVYSDVVNVTVKY